MSFTTDTGVAQWIAQLEGDLDPATGEPPENGASGIVYQNAAGLWHRWASKAALYPGLQELYARRDALDLLISVVQSDVDISLDRGGDGERLGQKAQRLAARREERQKEIERVEARASANRAPVVSPILAANPISAPQPGEFPTPPPWDGNSPVWTGTPYWPRPLDPLTGVPR